MMTHLVRINKAIPRHSQHNAPRTHPSQTTPVPSFNDNMSHDFIDYQLVEMEALPLNNPTTEHFPGAAQTYGARQTFMEQFESDVHADKRKANLYYPFASKSDWEMASWLLRSGLSMALIDEFLALEPVLLKLILLYCSAIINVNR